MHMTFKEGMNLSLVFEREREREMVICSSSSSSLVCAVIPLRPTDDADVVCLIPLLEESEMTSYLTGRRWNP